MPRAVLCGAGSICVRRQSRFGSVRRFVEQPERIFDSCKSMGIDEADAHFVVGVCGESEISVEPRGNYRLVKIKRAFQAGSCRGLMVDRVSAREGGDPLAKTVCGSKAVPAAIRFVQGHFVIPSSKLRTGRRAARRADAAASGEHPHSKTLEPIESARTGFAGGRVRVLHRHSRIPSGDT